MLSLDITVKTPKGNEEIHAVAKMVPPNEFLQQVFQTQITFRNEIGFYDNIVPILRKFQREQGISDVIDFFPKYYGSRLNLNGDSTNVDSDGAILLENLKVLNYQNFDRTKGFDLETSKLIIGDLAQLHAVPLALKLKYPEVFAKEVKTYLHSLKAPEGTNDPVGKILALIESIDNCKPYFERVKAVFGRRKLSKPEVREPFATISHNDLWVNNTMVKIEDGKSVKNKLVDFQGCSYASPAKDLIFFLFSSLQNDVVVKYCDYLIKLYHEKFVKILQELNCSTVEFSYENFVKEIEEEVEGEFIHIVFMFIPIFMPKDKTTELDSLKMEDIMKGVDAPPKEHIEKLALTIKEFEKRNWI